MKTGYPTGTFSSHQSWDPARETLLNCSRAINAVTRCHAKNHLSSQENGYVESFIGKMPDELLDQEIFFTLAEA